jgi:DNA (cytosine-5)-methyltransferase 1
MAGKGAGMSVSQADGGTRSGLLWEVERILDELENKPQILVMENVPEIVGTKNIKDFKKWEYKLRTLGYSNYVEILNAKNFGIPQSRRRCYMISILGDYAYDFPCKLRLKYKLDDLLEKNVDEKYYLSDAFLNYASGINYDNSKYNRSKMFARKLKTVNVDGIAGTITTREGGRSNDTFIVDRNETMVGTYQYSKSDKFMQGKDRFRKGKEIADTILTSPKEGIVLKNEPLKKALCNQLIQNGAVQEGDIVKHSYTSKILNGEKKAVETSDEMITLTTRGDCVGVVVDDKIKKVGNYGNGHHAKDVVDPQGVSPTITTGNHGLGQTIQQKNLRIRKLTPNECMHLMGFTSEDTNALKEIGLSDANIYHVAGDSIVTTVLVSLFSNLISENNSHIHIVENYVEKEIVYGNK